MSSNSASAYAEINYQKNVNLEYLSASPITNLNTVVVPANAAYNPFGVTVTNDPVVGATLLYRFTELGPRATETTNEFKRVVAGLKGKLTDTWSYDASLLYNRSTSDNALVSGWVSQAAVNAALADTNRATALNLFNNGSTPANNPATLAKLVSTVPATPLPSSPRSTPWRPVPFTNWPPAICNSRPVVSGATRASVTVAPRISSLINRHPSRSPRVRAACRPPTWSSVSRWLPQRKNPAPRDLGPQRRRSRRALQ